VGPSYHHLLCNLLHDFARVGHDRGASATTAHSKHSALLSPSSSTQEPPSPHAKAASRLDHLVARGNRLRRRPEQPRRRRPPSGAPSHACGIRAFVQHQLSLYAPTFRRSSLARLAIRRWLASSSVVRPTSPSHAKVSIPSCLPSPVAPSLSCDLRCAQVTRCHARSRCPYMFVQARRASGLHIISVR
jgi:hypothetical protein